MKAKLPMNILRPVPFLLLLLLPALLPLGGCVAVIAGGTAAGGTLYATGDLQSTLDAPPGRVRAAIATATTALELRSISQEADQLTGRYIYRTGDDTRITIKYRSVSDNATELSIRVGTFGDEALSQKILAAIKDAL
jgi:hypothetical protein